MRCVFVQLPLGFVLEKSVAQADLSNEENFEMMILRFKSVRSKVVEIWYSELYFLLLLITYYLFLITYATMSNRL